jgi:hypothetical protein
VASFADVAKGAVVNSLALDADQPSTGFTHHASMIRQNQISGPPDGSGARITQDLA